MRAECAALGGDGVVAIRLTIAPFLRSPYVVEFSAIGTAVRSRGTVHLDRPFLSDLSGQSLAKLMGVGYMPVDLVLGFAYEVRSPNFVSDDSLAVVNARNAEVPGYTELANRARARARQRLTGEVKDAGADGVIATGVELHVREDMHVARARVLGTALARFGHTATTSALPILRLGDRPAEKGGRSHGSGLTSASRTTPCGDSPSCGRAGSR